MKYIADTSVKGLKKKIQPSGNAWVLIAKQRIVNKTITITYGKVASISLTEARNRAKQDLALLSQGINPRDKQHELAQTGKTLSDAIQEYLTVRNIKPSTIESYRGTLTRNFSDWFEKPLRAISEDMVLARYKRIQKDVAERAIQKKKLTHLVKQKHKRQLEHLLPYSTASKMIGCLLANVYCHWAIRVKFLLGKVLGSLSNDVKPISMPIKEKFSETNCPRHGLKTGMANLRSNSVFIYFYCY